MAETAHGFIYYSYFIISNLYKYLIITSSTVILRKEEMQQIQPLNLYWNMVL